MENTGTPKPLFVIARIWTGFGITENTGKPKGKYLCKSSTAVPKERFSRGKGNWKIIFGDKNRRFFRK